MNKILPIILVVFFMGLDSVYPEERNFIKPTDAELEKFKSSYSGAYKDNKKHGQGSFYDPIKNIRYYGEWENDLYHGNGILIAPGSITTGTWENGILNGRANIIYCTKVRMRRTKGLRADQVESPFINYDLITYIESLSLLYNKTRDKDEWHSSVNSLRGAMNVLKAGCRDAATDEFTGIYVNGKRIKGKFSSGGEVLYQTSDEEPNLQIPYLRFMRNTYNGDFKSGVYHGKGVLILDNKNNYIKRPMFVGYKRTKPINIYSDPGVIPIYLDPIDPTKNFCMVTLDGEFRNGHFYEGEVKRHHSNGENCKIKIRKMTDYIETRREIGHKFVASPEQIIETKRARKEQLTYMFAQEEFIATQSKLDKQKNNTQKENTESQSSDKQYISTLESPTKSSAQTKKVIETECREKTPVNVLAIPATFAAELGIIIGVGAAEIIDLTVQGTYGLIDFMAGTGIKEDYDQRMIKNRKERRLLLSGRTSEGKCYGLAMKQGVKENTKNFQPQIQVRTQLSEVFFQSVTKYLEAQELLMMAYGKDKDAQKIKEAIIYSSNSKISESERMANSIRVSNESSAVIAETMLEQSDDLANDKRTYFNKAIKPAIAGYKSTILLFKVGSATIEYAKQDPLTAFFELSGFLTVLPSIPPYASSMMKTTKLILTYAKANNVENSENLESTLGEL